MADHKILQPLNIREMWEDTVAELAPSCFPPHAEITSEDIALMFLIRYHWDLKKINEMYDDDSSVLFRESGVCLVLSQGSKCLDCIEDEDFVVRSERLVERGVPGYEKAVRELSLERLLAQVHPFCGHYCKEHLAEDIQKKIDQREVTLKCKRCSICSPMSAIPLQPRYPDPYHTESLVDRYKELVDKDFFYYRFPKREICLSCGARFFVESAGTYTCGRCNDK